MAPLRFDALRAIEACYAPAADDRSWLANLAASLEPLSRGLPPIAYSYSVAHGRFRLGTSEPRTFEGPARAVWESAGPEVLRVWYSGAPPAAMASSRLRRTPRRYLEQVLPMFESTGVREALGIVAVEPDGQGVTITVPYAGPVRLPPRTLHQLGRVSAHLATALRLRSRVAMSAALEQGDIEAVLVPDGRVQHAAGAATDGVVREALASAVRSVERARGGLRRTSPDQALALWQALVEGRWSLVDHAEADGRRLVLARRNDPGVREPKALAPRERDVLAFAALGHSNKHIGYLMGLAPSTIATHLAAAMAKLGLRSRREVIAMFGPMTVG